LVVPRSGAEMTILSPTVGVRVLAVSVSEPAQAGFFSQEENNNKNAIAVKKEIFIK